MKTNPLSPIRWGILGTGQVAQVFARGLQALPDAKLAAIGSRSQATAQEFADALQVPKAYGAYEELVADPELDIIYIATPHQRHKDDCLLVLSAGKAVLCEKPFASNAAEAQLVMDTARAKNLFCMEAMWMRFMPLILEVATLIQQKAIGEVRLLTADNGRATRYDPAHRMFRPELGGSCLLDRGVYPLALAQCLFGEPTAISSQISYSETGVDEQVAITMCYANGTMALLASSLTAHTSNEAVITGSHGSIRIHAPYYNPTKVTVWTRPPKSAPVSGGNIRRWGRKQKLMEAIKSSWPGQWLIAAIYESQWPRRKGQKQVLFRPHTGNGYHYQAAEAMRCLRAGELDSPLMPLGDSIKVLQAVDRIKWPG